MTCSTCFNICMMGPYLSFGTLQDKLERCWFLRHCTKTMSTPACDHKPMWINIYVKVYNNKVMCHLSMKLSDKFHPNQMCTSDKTHFCERNTLKAWPWAKGSKGKQQNIKQGTKNVPPLNKQSEALLGNCSATDEWNRLWVTYLREQKKVNKGQELSG